jgi:NADPH-dependent 2,4-dienoyl-CoA reductase/sulfur reductase-like enzyme/nitrite reductase/ring-hydroxylating ferredoxin subunit
MGAGTPELKGPDLRLGVPIAQLKEGTPLLAHADGEAVMLVRFGDDVQALGATCTHYGGPVAEGLVTGDVVHCPWHHACFSLRTGEALAAPALNPLPRWQTETRDGVVFVLGREDADADALSSQGRQATGPARIVIAGAGAAGSAAAEMLRRLGHTGKIALVDPDADAPYDRPNLSKDYLAGNAPEEWIPLRPQGFYEEHSIDRVIAGVTAINTAEREVSLSNGTTLQYDALLLATGAEPVRINVPGVQLPHVHVLRSLADCRGLIRGTEGAHRAVVLGASFIGMEAAAALRTRGIEVTIVAQEDVPFVRSLGAELGQYIRSLHEEHGVEFRLGRTLKQIFPDRVMLDNGSEVQADLVLIGVGVRPLIQLAEAAQIKVHHGVIVDENFETSIRGIFAAGDIARFPNAQTGEQVRIEHWVVAQRQGQAAARSILGQRKPFTDVPFFWTQHYDVTLAYVGHASSWDRIQMDGTPADRDCAVRYMTGNAVLAVATIGRDDQSLMAERVLEKHTH